MGFITAYRRPDKTKPGHNGPGSDGPQRSPQMGWPSPGSPHPDNMRAPPVERKTLPPELKPPSGKPPETLMSFLRRQGYGRLAVAYGREQGRGRARFRVRGGLASGYRMGWRGGPGVAVRPWSVRRVAGRHRRPSGSAAGADGWRDVGNRRRTSRLGRLPILVSKADSLSDGTARQILEHNRTWKAVCGG